MSLDEIALTERDWRPHAQDIRDALDDAIYAVAASNDGRVHIGLIRPLLPEWCTGPQIGARMRGHVDRGALVWDGKSFALNGNRRTRNALRPCKVYALVKGLEDPK